MSVTAANDELIADLQHCLPEAGAVLTDPADRQRYEQGARYGSGQARCIVRPRTTAQVQAVVRTCAQHGSPLVVQGANTGLVAAATPDGSGRQVVLSTERMTGPLTIDAANRTAHVAAGVRLSQLNEAAAAHGLFFPIDLSADPSIGGMVATNTGGSRLLRYGDVRQNLLGLTAVLGDEHGTVLDLGSSLRKHNAVVDLKQLFVGTGGAHGVVTEAVLRLSRLPAQRAAALVALQSEQDALTLYTQVAASLHDFCSAFEGMSREALQLALDHVPSLSNPFPAGLPPYAVLIELSCGLGVDEGINLEDLLVERLGNLDIAGLDAVVGRAESLWALRHALSEGARHAGRVFAMDVSLPLGRLFEFRAAAKALASAADPRLIVADFGHLGDGGVHFNLVWPHAAGTMAMDMPALRQRLYDLVVYEFHGSFSAEHGVGPYNQDCYDRYTADAVLALSQRLKQVLDPDQRLGVVRFGPPSMA